MRLTVVLAIALMLGGGFAATSLDTALAGTMPGKTGDLDGDGAPTSIDAQLLLQVDAGLDEAPVEDYDTWFAGADVNCDTTVNALDATVILQASAGLYELRP